MLGHRPQPSWSPGARFSSRSRTSIHPSYLSLLAHFLPRFISSPTRHDAFFPTSHLKSSCRPLLIPFFSQTSPNGTGSTGIEGPGSKELQEVCLLPIDRICVRSPFGSRLCYSICLLFLLIPPSDWPLCYIDADRLCLCSLLPVARRPVPAPTLLTATATATARRVRAQ